MEYDTLSNIIKNKRKELGMTQQDLAKASNSSKANICVVENGGNPSWSTTIKILQALGFKVVIENLEE